MSRSVVCLLLFVSLAACVPAMPAPAPTPAPFPSSTFTPIPPTVTFTPLPSSTATPKPLVPSFDHIVIIMFENKEFGSVIGNPQMPIYNQLARQYTLLTQYYAITHPSLPNYIALMGGDTFGIDRNCNDCFINQRSLPDLIEESGRTWKTYQEDMPEPCFLGSKGKYAQKHNPFVYFDPIRLNTERCQKSVVPLTELPIDIASQALPNFIFITPNLCNDSHDCSLDIADAWLTNLLNTLIPVLDAQSPNYVVVMLFEEGQGSHTCCGLPEPGGGRVPVVLYSPLVQNSFEDATPYTHYSLLKTISQAWGLPFIGHAADDTNVLITVPWK